MRALHGVVCDYFIGSIYLIMRNIANTFLLDNQSVTID